MKVRFKIAALTLLISSAAYSQELYIPTNTNVYLSSGATLTAGGNLSNQTDGNTENITLKENASLVVLGDLENNGPIRTNENAEISVTGDLNNNSNILPENSNSNPALILNVNGNFNNVGTIESGTNGLFEITGDLSNTGSLNILEQAQMINFGNVMNLGFLGNAGSISLYGNWVNTGVYNSTVGEMQFLGGRDQQITNNYLLLSKLIMNTTGNVVLNGDSIKITGPEARLAFNEGILSLSPGTKLIVDESVTVNGGSTTSYLDGRITSIGTNYRRFPLGNNGHFSPIALEKIFSTVGETPRIELEYFNPNPEIPLPAEDVVGVSDRSVYEIELIKGSFDSTRVSIEFSDEQSEDFQEQNDIRRLTESLVIASSSEFGGVYESLGVEELFDTDSATFGTIFSEKPLVFDGLNKKYLAIALAARIPEEGIDIFIPNAFSPAASDIENQRFKVYGEKIADEGFEIEIFNKYSEVVYSSNSFIEASTIGWDGTNTRNGKEMPNGVYYYFVKVRRQINDDFQTYKGSIYLRR